jgi:hypothetical protein
MRTPEEELAYKVLMRDGTWGMTGCLAEAKGCIALRGHDVLDDLTQLHVRLLALMCSGLNCNSSSVECHFSSDLSSMADRLEDLAEARFIEWNGQEYEASALGKSVTRQIGVEMLGMDRFRMTGELEEAERLLKKLRP